MSERTLLAEASNYPKPQEGTWRMFAPDGRLYEGKSPLDLASQENAERIPPQERLRRILDGANAWGEEGIWLRSNHVGTDLTVLIERDGQWIPVIHENGGCPISHIVEIGGINHAIKKALGLPSDGEVKAP